MGQEWTLLCSAVVFSHQAFHSYQGILPFIMDLLVELVPAIMSLQQSVLLAMLLTRYTQGFAPATVLAVIIGTLLQKPAQRVPLVQLPKA
jgi:hypothetical protein